MMDYMFADGFMGTRAPFFMDVVTLIVALLPLLVYSSVLLVRKKYIKAHALTQDIIFLVSVVVIAYFETGVRSSGGFDAFILGSGVSHTYASVVMVVHILIATVTLFYWSQTVFVANVAYVKKRLPGIYSKEHKALALKSFFGIIFTSLTGIWVYLLLFVY